jgi:hypothetical protein
MKSLAATLLSVQLNNTGASLLLEGRHDHAVKTFVQALKLTRCLMRKERTPEQKKRKGSTPSRVKHGSHNLCSDLCNANSMAGDSTHISIGDFVIEGNVNSAKVELSSSFVFMNPILIDQDTAVTRERQCLMKLAIILIFNLGLTHHMLGLQQGPDSSTRFSNLRKAFSLYELSCNMQIQEDVLLSDLYAMAHLNNLGQIQAVLGNQGMAKKYFFRLLQHLLLFKECSKQEDERSHQELEGFFRNTTWLILRGPALAPAA